MSNFSGARRIEIEPTTRREMPSGDESGHRAGRDAGADAGAIDQQISRQKVVAVLLARATRLPIQKNQNVRISREGRAGEGAVSGSRDARAARALAGTVEEPNAPRPGSDPMKAAARPASTIVTDTAGHLDAPTASRAGSPNSELTQSASTNAAAP